MAGSCCSSTTEEGKKETNMLPFCNQDSSCCNQNCPIWAKKGEKPVPRDSTKVGH